jgi:LemA protein
VPGALPGAVPLILLAVTVLLAGVLSWVAGSRNGLTGLRELVREAWRQVDEELTERHELIPRLVQLVRTSAPGVGEAAEAVLAARSAVALPGSPLPSSGSRAFGSRAFGSPSSDSVRWRSVAEATLSAELDRLFALAAGHPCLVASQDFLVLQQELRETQDRIAAGRRRYNDAVQAFNARVSLFPSRLVALAFLIRPAEPFDGVGLTGSVLPSEPLDPAPQSSRSGPRDRSTPTAAVPGSPSPGTRRKSMITRGWWGW